MQNDKIIMSKYRLGVAEDDIKSSRSDLQETYSYRSSINRSYYAILHTMRAVLALDGFDSKKHSGVISEFRKRYIKTGIFPQEFSNTIGIAFDARNESDYKDFVIISKDEALTQLKNAETFLDAVSAYLEMRWQDDNARR